MKAQAPNATAYTGLSILLDHGFTGQEKLCAKLGMNVLPISSWYMTTFFILNSLEYVIKPTCYEKRFMNRLHVLKMSVSMYLKLVFCYNFMML